MTKIKKVVFTIFSILLMSCTTAKRSLDYIATPLATRSPTLPEETYAWKPIFGFAPSKDASTTTLPLQWESGVTDNLTLVWMPLPLQLRYTFMSGEASWISAEFALFGTNYSRSRDYNWRPSLQLTWKRALTSEFAFELGLYYQAEVKRTSSEPFSRSAFFQLGAIYQLTPWLTLSPYLWVLNEKGEVRTFYLGEIPNSLIGASAESEHWRLPLGLKATFKIGPTSEFYLETRIHRIGYDSNYLEVPVFLTWAQYW